MVAKQRSKKNSASGLSGTYTAQELMTLPFAAFHRLAHMPLFGGYSQVQQRERGNHEGNNVGHSEGELALYGVALRFSMSLRYRPE